MGQCQGAARKVASSHRELSASASILDEAQQMSASALSELWLLSSAELDSRLDPHHRAGRRQSAG
jgi:hypothetical protein